MGRDYTQVALPFVSPACRSCGAPLTTAEQHNPTSPTGLPHCTTCEDLKDYPEDEEA